ncbi:F-box-like domain-containing protein [Ceratobasidium sp. AG-Ba]|nr:F-box-like domain-containing protein [Ceratobasidium sp. AG-Ba]QRW07082.1 F-box-like domain-containing protein [Ceratobasidium sp. AG-Ba]
MDRVEELDRFLRPLMSRTWCLKLKLGFYADKLNSAIVKCWSHRNVSAAQDELHVIGVRTRGLMFPHLRLLSPASNPETSLQHVTSLTLRGCRFPTGAIAMPVRLIELHLEDFHQGCGFNSQHLAALSQCPDLRSLAYINCHMQNPRDNIRVTLKELRVLRLESHEISHELHHVLQILHIGSDSLRMSLSLSDNQQFIAASRSFFGRTKVKRLYARNVEDHASLRSLLCPIPSLEQLAVDRSYICDEPFDQFRTKNIQNGDQAWWPGLQKLYLNSCWVDANCLQYTTRLHTSLKGVYMSKPKNEDGSKWTDAQIKTTSKALKEGYGTTVHHHVKPLTHWSVVTMK